MAAFSSSGFSTSAFSTSAFDFGTVATVEFGGHFGEDDYRRYRKRLKKAADAASEFDRKKYVQDAIKVAEIVEDLPTKTEEIRKVAAQVDANEPIKFDFTILRTEIMAAIAYIERVIEAQEAIMAENDDEEGVLLLI